MIPFDDGELNGGSHTPELQELLSAQNVEPQAYLLGHARQALMQQERRLRRSQELLTLASKMARLGWWTVDLASKRVIWSDEVCAIHEVPAGMVMSLEDALAYYAPESLSIMGPAFRRCAEEGVPYDLEVELISARGKRFWARAIGMAQRNPQGQIVRVEGAFQDISEFKRVAEQNRRLALTLTRTLESITDAFVALDSEWRYIYVNGHAEQLLKRRREDMLGRIIWDLFPELPGTVVEHEFRRASQDSGPRTFEFFHEAASVWYNIQVYSSEYGLSVYFRDITERRREREAARLSELRLQEQASLLDQAHDAILVRNLDHEITYWNRSAEEVFGFPPEEALGRHHGELLAIERGAFVEATRQVLEEGQWSGEWVQTTRFGQKLDVLSRWTLTHDEAGAPRSILVIATNITERKRWELQTYRNQRLESLGTLAGGIAHDLNNVLTPIRLAAELLEIEEQDAEKRELLHTILQSAQRGAEMVRQVLSFARGAEGRREPVDISELVQDVQRIVNDTFLKHVQVRSEFAPDLPPVLGDSTQLHQVLLNLCVNARDAMPQGGTLTISAHHDVVDEQYAAAHGTAVPGPYVVIRVTDTGTGMSPETLNRIFEPFFTTKELGQGTGLGLATSLGIVKSHGGFMEVESKLNVGSQFSLFLPGLAPPENGRTSASGPRELPLARGEMVLVVDDEKSIRESTRRSLENHGFRTMLASDGVEAVALYAAHRDDISLVLTDMMMPVLDGPDTVRALLKMNPSLRIIGSSGVDTGQAPVEGLQAFLPKPYSLETLLNTVHTVLQSGASPVR